METIAPRRLFYVAIVACLAWSASAAQAAPPDHYLCYKGKGKRVINVTLADHVDAPGSYASKGLKLHCNPADKEGEGVVDPDSHLTVYKIKGPHLKRSGLEVVNQFGTFFVDTKKADTLMVPASKSLAPAPPPGAPPAGNTPDHYRCLKAKTSKGTATIPKGTTVSVDDQFGARQVEIKKPSKLCVATDKNSEGVNNPADHLLCYKIKTDIKTAQAGIQTIDQFGALSFEVKKEAELCVPSTLPGQTCPVAFGFTSVARGASGTTRLERGWTGDWHHQNVADGHTLTIASTCASSALPCGECTFDGVAAPLGRCTNDRTVECDTIAGPDVDDCGGADCEFFLAPPTPDVIGNNPVCVQTILETDITGSIDNEAGAISMAADVRDVVHSGVGLLQPCPICAGDTLPNDGVRDGLCVGGDRDGLSCDTGGEDPTFGAVSVDCPPQPGSSISGLGLPRSIDLGTGSTSLAFSTPCDAPLGLLDCACAVCSLAPAKPCRDDSECGPGEGLCDSNGGGPAAARHPNKCSDLTCTDVGGEVGECQADVGLDTMMYCDGEVRADGSGLLACNTQGDCDAIDTICSGADCGTCSLAQRRRCFLDPIEATGAPHPSRPTLVGTSCLNAVTNTAVNGVSGLPGPQREAYEMRVGRVY